jgi:hypothetical protein
MRIKIHGKVWTIRDADVEPDYGQTCHADRTIEINPRQSEWNRLDTVIHEMLHAIYPKMHENEIRNTSGLIRDAIWGDKWRRDRKEH